MMRRQNSPPHFYLLTEGDKQLIFRTIHASPIVKEVHLGMTNLSKDVRMTVEVSWWVSLFYGKRYKENLKETFRHVIHEDLGLIVKVERYSGVGIFWRLKMRWRKFKRNRKRRTDRIIRKSNKPKQR